MALEAGLGRTGRLGVMANLGGQLAQICRQLKGKPRGTPVKNFLDQVIRSRRPALTTRGASLVAA